MRRLVARILISVALLGCICRPVAAATVNELARIKGQGENILRGQGLVFGLKGTGESGKELVLAQQLAQYFRNNGSPVPDLTDLNKNVAIVNVTIKVPEGGARTDDVFDVSVESAFNATSLAGGVLYITPMLAPKLPDPKDTPWAFAEGRIIIENPAFPTTGRIRGGGHLVKDILGGDVGDSFTLILRPHFQGWGSTNIIATAITEQYYNKGSRGLSGLPPVATVIDDRSIRIDIPATERLDHSGFIGDVLATKINVALLKLPAQVIYNSETQMIILTGDVEISPVAITQKDLTITTTAPPPAATPDNPMIETKHWAGLSTGAKEGDRAKLQDLLNAFNQLKIGVPEQIAILSMLEKSGKLHARLIKRLIPMNAASINSFAPPESLAPTRTDLAAAQRSFLSVLGKHVDDPTAHSPAQHARQVAEQMVSISLIQPMLKQLRSTNNAAPPFAPTDGEKQFRALTDADLAQNIVRAKHFPLVDKLAQNMLERGERLASGESVQDELGKARTPDHPTPPGVTSVAR